MMLVTTAFLLTAVVHAAAAAGENGATARASLMEVRHVVYDSMYRNDAEGLRLTIASLQKLPRTGATERAYIDYYTSVAHWALSAAELQAGHSDGALKAARVAVEHAKAGVDARPNDAEFYAMLANALIVVAVLDPPNFMTTARELAPVRRQALTLGPDNPRVVVMDAGMIFNNPPERGGGQERGIARWREALELFEREANARAADALAPRWGHALAWGWLANILMSMGDEHKEGARQAATTALQMRPDFWYVREQVEPKLK